MAVLSLSVTEFAKGQFLCVTGNMGSLTPWTWTENQVLSNRDGRFF